MTTEPPKNPLQQTGHANEASARYFALLRVSRLLSFGVRRGWVHQMADETKREFDVGPAEELQPKYGWYAENRPVIRVEVDEVPPLLRDLIPFVERWAIRCDITRHDYFVKQPEAEVREFAQVVGRREKEINLWLDSIRGQWPEAGYQFMYLLKAWCEAACEFPDEVA